MGKLFDLESPFMRILNRVADLMIMNFIVSICCIPIFTAGAAFTAMHYVFLKSVRGEEGYLVKGFFKSFKQNFKQATILWLLMLLVIAILVGDFWIMTYSGLQFPRVLLIILMAISIALVMVGVYIFPVLSRFENSIKNTLKNAFCMAVLHLPKTVLMVILLLLPGIVLYFSTYAGIFVILFGISVPAYLSALLYSGIFKKFEPEAAAAVSDYEFTVNMGDEEEERKEEEDGQSD